MGHSPSQILVDDITSPLAFVFPGQGSQFLGMLSEWRDMPIVSQTFEEASNALGYNVWELAQDGPEATLNQTEFTQPALLTASVALFRAWLANCDERPVFLAGHSLGEYSALVCAGALSLEAGVTLVAERGRLMQRAVPAGTGAMAAILGLTDEQVVLACRQAKMLPEAQGDWIVEPANFNSPQQVVIAGHKDAVASAMDCAKALGAKRAIPLAVSVPSHCALMRQAAIDFELRLKALPLKLPSIPVIHNTDATTHNTIEGLQHALISQLFSPVRWVDCIQKMAVEGVQTIIECGPGAVLTGLNKRIVPTLKCFSVNERKVVCP